jgi:chemotaxis protein methyltransferase CheR
LFPEVSQHEFIFTPADFERVRKLIYTQAGIALAPGKQDMVYSRLARRVRAKGFTSFQQYLDHLEADSAGERELFINSLTTNHTAFFREPHHFELLAEHLRHRSRRPLRIWCAAAATGEEVWSLAMTACEAFDSLAPPVSIIASDIDTHALATAGKGVYPAERVAQLGPRVQRFFLQGTSAQNVEVRPELKKLVRFARINLLDARWPVEGPLDALFCRNVMIYFDKLTQHAVLKKFHPILAADGRLYAGHSESFSHAADLFSPLGRTVYAPQGGARSRG